VWDLVFVNPIVNLLLIFYKLMGHQTILAVTVLTVLVRLLIAPLMLSQQKMARQQAALQPKMEKLRQKYNKPEDQQQLALEQQKLFTEAGINPLAGCLPLLIQFPLMIALYQGIIRALAGTPLELLSLPSHIYRIPGLDLSSLVPLNSTFLWLDLALPDPYFVLPILVMATTWLSQKLTMMPSKDPQAQSMNQSMMITMPLMLGYFSFQYAAGLSVYFIIGNLVTILQFYMFRQHYVLPQESESVSSKSEPVAEPPAKSESASDTERKVAHRSNSRRVRAVKR